MPVDMKVQQAVDKSQPAKFSHLKYIVKALVFHIYFVPTTILLFPILILRALVPGRFGRYQNWSMLEAIGVYLTQRAMRSLIRFRMQPMPPREHGWREMDNALGGLLSLINLSGPGGLVSSAPPVIDQVAQYSRTGRRDTDWFDPPSLDALKGILSIKVDNECVRDSSEYEGPALVEPKWAKTRIKGYWFMHSHNHVPIPGPAGCQKRPVLLYFHGGACVTFAAGDIFMGQTLCKALSSNVEIDTFSVDYNLAPFAPFPVQILQALGGYLHLIHNYGYHPSQIYLGGDSFGAWTALQLDHYLRTDGKHIMENWSNKAPTHSGVPGLLLLSPWVCAFDIETKSRSTNSLAHTHDIIVPAYGHWGVDAMKLGPRHKDRCPAPLTSSWQSPYCFSKSQLSQLPPTFVSVGSLEGLFDEDVQFVREIQAVGGKVELHIEDGGVHDYGTMSTFSNRFIKTCQVMKEWCHRLESTS